MNKVQIEISWNTLWKILLFIGVILLFYLSRQALGVLFAGVVVSLGLEPVVEYLEKLRIGRLFGAMIVFVTIILIFTIVIWLVFPTVLSEVGSFFSQINEAFRQLIGLELLSEEAIAEITKDIGRTLGAIITPGVAGVLSAVFGSLILFVSTAIISFYLLVEKNGTERMLKIIMPRAYEDPVLTVFGRFKNKIRVWLVAQLALSVMVGSLVGIGLLALDYILPVEINHILLIALLAAVFEIVPIIGPILSGAIAFLVSVPTSFALGFFVVGLFFIVQQIESGILTPMIMRKAMRIHPILILVALLAGHHAAGIIGILLAVPVALLVQEIFNYMAEHRVRNSEEQEA